MDESVPYAPAHAISIDAFESLEFVYELEGAIAEVDVADLTRSLGAMAQLIQEANRALYPNSPPVRVAVRPIEKGSYDLHYALSYLQEASPLLAMAATQGPGLHQLAQVLGDLGVIKRGYEGVLKVMARLRGKPVKTEKTGEDEFNLESTHGPVSNVKGNVHTLIQNPIIIENLTLVYAGPLDNPTVTDVKSFLKTEPDAAVTVTKSEAPAIREYAESPDPVEVEKTTEHTNRVFLHPKRGPFGAESGQWWFMKGDEAIPVTIKDKKFLESYGAGNPRLNAEDVLEVDLHEKQKVIGTKITSSYTILNVVSYTPAPRPQSLL